MRREEGFVLAFLAWGASSSPPLHFVPVPLVDRLALENMSMENNKLTNAMKLTLSPLVRFLLAVGAVSRCAPYQIVLKRLVNSIKIT